MGKDAMRMGDYSTAIQHFSKAIEVFTFVIKFCCIICITVCECGNSLARFDYM